MAVEVIGESDKAKKETTCSNCAAILRYTLADTKTETRTDYGGGSDTYRVLECPKCHKKIDVELY